MIYIYIVLFSLFEKTKSIFYHLAQVKLIELNISQFFIRESENAFGVWLAPPVKDYEIIAVLDRKALSSGVKDKE